MTCLFWAKTKRGNWKTVGLSPNARAASLIARFGCVCVGWWLLESVNIVFRIKNSATSTNWDVYVCTDWYSATWPARLLWSKICQPLEIYSFSRSDWRTMHLSIGQRALLRIKARLHHALCSFGTRSIRLFSAACLAVHMCGVTLYQGMLYVPPPSRAFTLWVSARALWPCAAKRILLSCKRIL